VCVYSSNQPERETDDLRIGGDRWYMRRLERRKKKKKTQRGF
jgi:hypothetical protein